MTHKILTASLERMQAENDLPRVKIVANAGSLMEFDDGDVILNIDGLNITSHSDKPPLLHSHDWQRPIGHFENCTIENGRIMVTALLSCDNADAREVATSLNNGFPWQASLGFSITDYQEFSPGETIKANGQTYKASNKTYLANAIDVWECSVVLFGADDKTAVLKAKQKEEKKEMEETKENKIETIDVNAEIEKARNAIKEAEQKEIARVNALKELAEKYNAQASLADAIACDKDAGTFELEVLRASYGKAPAVQVKKEEGENVEDVKKVFECAAVKRAGLNASHYDAKTQETADKYRNHDFRDLFEALTGYKPTYEARRQGDVWTAGASTYNLNSLLADAGSAIMLQAFESDLQQWRNVFKVSTVNDFKTVDRWRTGADVEFKKLANGGEMEHFTADDYKFQIKADVYARQGEVTYQDLVNGQFLDVFAEIMRRFAQGAGEAINKACWTEFLNPPADAQGNAFYSAAHNNLKTSCALTYANLAQAVSAYVTRKRDFGADKDAYLGIRPTKIIVPTELEWTARLITKAGTFSPQASTVVDYNPASAYGFEVVSIPQLSDATFGGAYSADDWYLSNDPNRLASFEIAFLNGQQAPSIRQQDITCGRLGIAFDGHIDFGVASEDYRGSFKCEA